MCQREVVQDAARDEVVAEVRELGEELRKDFERRLAAAEWNHRKEINELKFDAQEELKRHEADTVSRLRDQHVEVCDDKLRMKEEREEARAEAAELAEQVEQLQMQLEQLRVALERVREMSKGALLEQACAREIPHHTIPLPYHTIPYHMPYHTTPTQPNPAQPSPTLPSPAQPNPTHPGRSLS